MFWSLVFNLILIVLVIHLCVSAFRYVKVSLFHHYLIPVYSFIMLLITMQWTRKDLLILLVLCLSAIGFGILETLDLTFQKKPGKKTGSWKYEMRRGWPYVIGWASVILLGLVLSDVIGRSGFYHLFVDKVFETIWEEVNPLSFFTQSHPWYIWALSSVSSLTFTLRGTHMLAKQEKENTVPIAPAEEEGKKHKHHHHK